LQRLIKEREYLDPVHFTFLDSCANESREQETERGRGWEDYCNIFVDWDDNTFRKDWRLMLLGLMQGHHCSQAWQ